MKIIKKDEIKELLKEINIKEEVSRLNKKNPLLYIFILLCVLFFILGRISVSNDENKVCKSYIKRIMILNEENKENLINLERLKSEKKQLIINRAQFVKEQVESIEIKKEKECSDLLLETKKKYIELKCRICK